VWTAEPEDSMWTDSIRAGITVFAGLLSVAGCAAVPPAAEPPSLDGTAWTLASLPGTAPVAGATPTVEFAGGRIAGTDGCNRYTGSYEVVGGVLRVSRLASTMMACAPDVAAQAKAFTDALAAAHTFGVADGRLELRGADGTLRAALDAQSLDLSGTSWRATMINNGREAVVGVLAGTTVTLEFREDGKAGGSAGCNRWNAGFRSGARALSFTRPMTTRMACPEPPGAMEQERNFLQALETVAVARREGDRLELRRADGALAVSLELASAPRR
jgi:heat shock protein HslJ